VSGLRPDKLLRFTTYLRITLLAEFELNGAGGRIRIINGLGAELQTKRDAATGPPSCLIAPSAPCGERNSPLGGAFVPRRRPSGYPGTTR
jgi:hypothetical protein